jgi:hypothetical protein
MSSSISSWHSRLLPYMITMLFGLTLFFFIATMIQLYVLQNRVAATPELNIDKEIQHLLSTGSPPASPENAVVAIQARLEAHSIARRYAIGQSILMARLWARYLGFVTGMILSLVGAVFILGKLREASSSVNIDASFAKIALVSTSPGLIMTVLGTALMLATILTNPEIQVNDARVYLSDTSVLPPTSSSASQKGATTADSIVKKIKERAQESK